MSSVNNDTDLPQRLVIDASVALKGYLFEEGSAQAQAIFKDRALGHVELVAPALMPYEVVNALLMAARRGRLPEARATEILEEFAQLKVPTRALESLEKRSWALAWEYGRTVYDAAYLALTESEGAQFVTGDRRLYNAVGSKLDWVIWLEDYKSQADRK